MAESIARFIKKIALALFYILIYFAFLHLLFGQVEFLEEDAENYGELVTILASVASMAVYLVILYLREVKVTRYIKIKNVTLLDTVLALMLAFGYRILTGAYLMWSADNVPMLQKSLEGAQSGYNLNTMTTLGIVSVVVSVCIVAPIFEEVLFRGLILGELKRAMPDGFAVVLQAVLFGLAHAVLAQSIFAMVYALILGALYLKVKNIAVVILAHVFFNISSVLEVKNADMINQMFVTGLLLTVSSIVIFFYIYKRKKPASTAEITGGNINV